jgi:hypothetical protein
MKKGVPSLEILCHLANRDKWEEDIESLPLQERMRLMNTLCRDDLVYQLMFKYNFNVANQGHLICETLRSFVVLKGAGKCTGDKITFENGRVIQIYSAKGYRLSPNTPVIRYSDDYLALLDFKKPCESFEYYVNVIIPIVSKMADEILK